MATDRLSVCSLFSGARVRLVCNVFSIVTSTLFRDSDLSCHQDKGLSKLSASLICGENHLGTAGTLLDVSRQVRYFGRRADIVTFHNTCSANATYQWTVIFAPLVLSSVAILEDSHLDLGLRADVVKATPWWGRL